MSMKFFAELTVHIRNIETQSSLNKLRYSGLIPGIIYNLERKKTLAVSLDHHSLEVIFNKDPSALTRIYQLNLEKKHHQVLIKEVQFNTLNDKIEHIDFMIINKDSIVELEIPVRIINKADCPGVKKGGDVFVSYYSLKLKGPAINIPEAIDIDVSGKEIGHRFYSQDIELPKGFHFLHNIMIAKVSGKRVQVATATNVDTNTPVTATTTPVATTKQAPKVASK